MNNNQNNSQIPMNDGYLPRSSFVSLLQIGLNCKEYRFTRQIALQWLAAFPGDLQVSQVYAQALIGENRIGEARAIIKALCQADPENEEAVQLWLSIEQSLASGSILAPDKSKPSSTHDSPFESLSGLQNWLMALNGRAMKSDDNPATSSKIGGNWGEMLFNIRKSITANEFSDAEQQLPGLLNSETLSPLVAITHLKLLQVNPAVPLAARRSLGEYYHRRWPDCIACIIHLASWLLQDGAVERAVALMHQASARDVSGQIANRVLGANHPYKSLWPNNLALAIQLSLPAIIAASLGLNRLSPGELSSFDSAQMEGYAIIAAQDKEPLPGNEVQSSDTHEEHEVAFTATAVACVATELKNQEVTESELEIKSVDEDVVRFSAELDRMAVELNQPPASQYDGRFPVYVIFSVYGNLIAQYGQQNAEKLEAEMKALSEAAAKRLSTVLPNHASQNNRWDSVVFLPDKLESATSFGIEPLKNVDPWSLKLALADLDKVLRKKGEMIGAILIAGGPEIVPFHKLPNPVNDPDGEVTSDNPYTTRDENYFIQEWPVGRLPGDSSKDPSLLLESLQKIRQRYTVEPKSLSRTNRWLAWITSWFKPTKKSVRKGFGATAAVWRQASFQVYRPLGDIKTVLVSPPYSVNGNNGNGRLSSSLPFARLGYFNLHGLADAAEWYGQRDPGENADGPDYPIALRPADIRDLGDKIPLVVFSEACYGAHIQGKSIDQALALQFLKSGTQIVVGSTTMSYGAINTPLIAADLLGYNFWKGLLDGLPAGEALQRAKIQLASEMHERQGYLDGEDQKTLISFVLFGDPLAQISTDIRTTKHLRRLTFPTLQVKTVCDRTEESQQLENMPPEVMARVKQFVATYLPGMSDARATYAAERSLCQCKGHLCPTGQLNRINPQKLIEPEQGTSGRHVVVLSKTPAKGTSIGQQVHPQYARLTLDTNGKLIKIVVSR